MTDSFIYDMTLSPSDQTGKHIGDIDVRITYVVDSWGAPARVNYDENDHPAEAPTINIVHVEMLNAPKSGRDPVYIDAWDWLCDWAAAWCDEFAEELAGKARLDVEGKRDAHEDSQYRERRLGAEP